MPSSLPAATHSRVRGARNFPNPIIYSPFLIGETDCEINIDPKIVVRQIQDSPSIYNLEVGVRLTDELRS